ncbi:hypothetical protein BDW74DRAFT_41414 [Aspergillus multicolor]|uniref:DUF5572 domain-containing protein n=1 Tax=Aspergillus multicolor TaxID=41759 RepID=UPI003CCC9C87
MDTATELEASSPPPRAGTPNAQSDLQQPQADDIFEKLRTYPFAADPEFASGLAMILGHPETPASEEEISCNDDLVLQAKCYYFTRKNNLASPLNGSTYKSWLESIPASNIPINEVRETRLSTTSTQPLPGNSGPVSTPASQEPAYPNSFAHIVELITTGQPIPGIQQIPDTLLTGQGAASARPRRLKPWEKEENV